MSNAIALPVSTSSEEWRPIPNYEETYLVSSLGRVFSRPRWKCQGGMLKIKKGNRGYPLIGLCQNSVQKTYMLHHVMALTFLGPRPFPEAEVRHLDCDPWNTRLSNLAYGTHSENARDTVAQGRHWYASRTHCPQGHPYAGDNLYINPSNGGRVCRTCNRVAQAARDAAVKAAKVA